MLIWARWVPTSLAYLAARCVYAVLAAVFPAAWEMHRAEYERHVIAWFVGAVFAGLAVSQSLLFVLLTFCL